MSKRTRRRIIRGKSNVVSGTRNRKIKKRKKHELAEGFEEGPVYGFLPAERPKPGREKLTTYGEDSVSDYLDSLVDEIGDVDVPKSP